MALARVAAKRQQPVPLQRPPRHTAVLELSCAHCVPAPGRSAPHHTSGTAACCCPALFACGFRAGREGDGFQPPPL